MQCGSRILVEMDSQLIEPMDGISHLGAIRFITSTAMSLAFHGINPAARVEDISTGCWRRTIVGPAMQGRIYRSSRRSSFG